ncbi:Mov34/MPN/PAD-1 family protein [Candidatus Micrarchaeota archaeon]|nr:Mov34/MPN/PAD-1 family protein [Candidatus Micrarchaeota archaeon]
MFEVYVHEKVLKKAEKHYAEEAEKGLEAMGLLLGNAFTHEGSEYVVIEDYSTGENEATSVSVRFSKKAFPKLAKDFEEGGKIIVGWSHAHPSYGCFLSTTDLRTQNNYFDEDFHVALVIDPTRETETGFEKKFFKLCYEGYREASYAVIKEK